MSGDLDSAREVGAPFGVEPELRMFEVGVDRVVRLEGGKGLGVEAHELAEDIAHCLGAHFELAHGIGTRLRRACEAMRKVERELGREGLLVPSRVGFALAQAGWRK